MLYVPRLTAPGYNDKWWRTTSSGGVNPCIHISGGSVLPNCFSGDTEIITSGGNRRLLDIVGQLVEILTINNTWRFATIQHFGKQPLWKVTMSNGHSYRASANHRWLVWYTPDKYEVVTTCKLLPYMPIKVQDRSHTDLIYIESAVPLDVVEDVYCPVEPITHTCTLSGGELTGQCVGYAWGRFAEIQNAPCPTLPTANAGDWWELAKGFQKGQVPKLGAVAVWGKAGEAGHVAIVEQVNADGSCNTSNSAYGGTRFYMQPLYPSQKYTWGNGFYLKGFIYHPYVTDGTKSPSSTPSSSTPSTSTSVNKLSQFLNEAMKHVGEGGSWTWKKSGLAVGIAWCAAFVVAIGLQVGDVIGKVIYNSFSVSAMVRQGVKQNMGTFSKGPFFGASITPQPGDLIVFRWNGASAYSGQDEYFADHVGIVREVKNGTVYTVEGNSVLGPDGQERVRLHQYQLTNHCISGYFKPAWNRVGGSADPSTGLAYTTTPLYESESTNEDATVREVGYISSTGKPSISTEDYKLSVINYTSALSALVSLPEEALSMYDETKVDASRLSMTNARPIFKFFEEKKLSAAQSVGILAGIRFSSNLKPDKVNKGIGAIGLCQWVSSRKYAMIQTAGNNWQRNLTGQLNFIWYELNSSKRAVLNSLRALSQESVNSAVKCAEIFCKQYIQPGNILMSVAECVKYAKEFWTQLTIVSNASSGSAKSNSSAIITKSGKVLVRGTDIVVPSTIPQVGIDGTNFNYTYFSTKSNANATIRELCKLWKSSGQTCNRNIATIDGYYVISVSSIFGKIGDLVTVVLANGTKFNAIIGSIWACNSNYGDKKDKWLTVINWAKKGRTSVERDTVIRLDLTGWQGQAVYKIVNYGTYLDEG